MAVTFAVCGRNSEGLWDGSVPLLMGRLGNWLLGRTPNPTTCVERVGPIEGTSVSLWNEGGPIDQFWNQYRDGWWPTPSLASRVWVAARCVQLNSQQIAGMPLIWHGPPSEGSEPRWISSPDANLFPNGIGDALFAIVGQVYSWGYSLQWITDFYENGFPRTWTVLDSAKITPTFEDGRRVYKPLGSEEPLDARRIVQIDRNPSTGAHGTSALSAYAQAAYGLLAAQNQSLSVSDGGKPQAILKPAQRLDKQQAEDLRENWRIASQSRGAMPAVIPPGLEYIQSFVQPVRHGAPGDAGVGRSGTGDRLRGAGGAAEHGDCRRVDVPEPERARRDVVAVRAPPDRHADRERVQRADVAARAVRHV